MRCYTVDGRGLASLKMVDRPPPGPLAAGEVRIDVHAVALNYRDLLVASGQYGGTQNPPIIAASDMSGVVSEVGPGVTDFKLGDHVVNAPLRNWPAGMLCRSWSRSFVGGQGVDGVLAEQVSYPAASLVNAPKHLSHEQASTLVVAGLTAWATLVTHGNTKPGQWVLIHGTGGVAIFATQISRMLGARIIQTTSNKKKAERLRTEFGVHATLDYRDESWPEEVRRLTAGQGVDVVVELAGGESLSKSIQACNYGARIGIVGVLDGLESSINVFSLIMHQVTVRGIYMESAAEMRRFSGAVEAGSLNPVIDRVFPMENVKDAYSHLHAQKHFGKIVIQVRA